MRWLRGAPAALALLAFAVVAGYLHTLDVPFTLDDHSSIVENDLVHRWPGWGALWAYAPLRVLGYASFALNHRLGAFAPAGYHLVNIVIHWLASVAVFALVRGMLRTPRGAAGAAGPLAAGLPLLVAALFALHPLQTQAVTYVVQRLASMAAASYLGSLACYLQARLATTGARRGLWGGAALLLATLALLTKENAATLPLAVALLELALFPHHRRSILRLAAGTLATLALVWLAAAAAFEGDPLSLRSMGAVASQAPTLPRADYLATQLPILWHYVRLFVWPVGLHLDYPPGPVRDFGEAAPWLALAGHLAAVVLAIALWRRRPLIAWGALFYYLAHAVESSVIPIPELAFEHRAYLPNAGLCLIAGWALWVELPRRTGRRAAPALALLVTGALAILTWQRNQLWRDPIAFGRDNVRLAPGSARAWGSLGKHLILAGRPGEGLDALHEAMRLRRLAGGEEAVEPLDVVNVAMALQALGRGGEALPLIERRLAHPVTPYARAMLLLNRGNIEFGAGRLAEAEASYREALRHRPMSLPARANLASALARRGRFAEAESLSAAVLETDPSQTDVRRNLLAARAGRLWEESRTLLPNDPERADRAARSAIRALEELVRLDPADSLARRNLGIARAEAAARRPR
jgi:tetratricopeptide (TPR) repeat protein